ncbi:YdcF family protein [Saccharopolyspora sp. K220]|nr:YdcF family protein [Saccharopolyspora soli]MCI2420436.1 YdcF family protein [Saccharopolyspora soli]
MTVARIPEHLRVAAQVLWDYHRLDHDLRPVDVALGLGSRDPGVAVYTAELYHRGLFPRIVFSGANAPTTVERFPRGEAVHYREIAIERGVPAEVIFVETDARNTGDNIALIRKFLERQRVPVRSMLLLSRPYQQRRAYATAKKIWPEIHFRCSAQQQSLDDHLESIGDVERVLNMLVGDTQRITVYANAGFAIAQHVPDDVQAAYEQLVAAGYTSRLVN